MSKPNIVIRAFAVSVVLLLLTSGFTVMAYGSLNSNHNANENMKKSSKLFKLIRSKF
jgi:hypothetical protein